MKLELERWNIVVVISLLIALMRDQMHSLTEKCEGSCVADGSNGSTFTVHML